MRNQQNLEGFLSMVLRVLTEHIRWFDMNTVQENLIQMEQ
jgi:hypothetical protein